MYIKSPIIFLNPSEYVLLKANHTLVSSLALVLVSLRKSESRKLDYPISTDADADRMQIST
jgi:hypothetical protein